MRAGGVGRCREMSATFAGRVIRACMRARERRLSAQAMKEMLRVMRAAAARPCPKRSTQLVAAHAVMVCGPATGKRTLFVWVMVSMIVGGAVRCRGFLARRVGRVVLERGLAAAPPQ